MKPSNSSMVTEPNTLPDCLVSVVMPVYNEARTLERAIERVRAVSALKIEIVCVDDASTDGSKAILERLLLEKKIDYLVTFRENQGKGAAVRRGFECAQGQIVAVLDADLEYDPAELPGLVAPIMEGKADAVYGTRYFSGHRRAHFYWHTMVNKLLTTLSNMLSDLYLSDVATCWKVVRRDLLKMIPLGANRFGFDFEITARLAQAQARVYEVPATYTPRTYAEGKKITWKDGFAALWYIFLFNVVRRGEVEKVELPSFEEAPSY